MSELIGELCEPFKSASAKQDLVTVVGDPQAVKFLAAFNATPSDWIRPDGDMPDVMGQRWLWLWRGFLWDVEEIAKASRLSEELIWSYGSTCSTMRIIFPDGEISVHATELIMDFTKLKYPKKVD